MVNILSMCACSGNCFENNPTTTYYDLTSDYLASSLFNRPDMDVTDMIYHDGIRGVPVDINNQGFHGSGSVFLRTNHYDIILCIYPRSDRNDEHINFNLFYYIRSNGVLFKMGTLFLPINIHKIDAQVARIQLKDQNGVTFADRNIPLMV